MPCVSRFAKDAQAIPRFVRCNAAPRFTRYKSLSLVVVLSTQPDESQKCFSIDYWCRFWCVCVYCTRIPIMPTRSFQRAVTPIPTSAKFQEGSILAASGFGYSAILLKHEAPSETPRPKPKPYCSQNSCPVVSVHCSYATSARKRWMLTWKLPKARGARRGAVPRLPRTWVAARVAWMIPPSVCPCDRGTGVVLFVEGLAG